MAVPFKMAVGPAKFVSPDDIVPPISQVIVEFTAGENLAANRAVYISANNTVKATNADRLSSVIGVTKEAASLNDPVKVIVHGKATCLVSGTVAAGDMLTSTTTGRLTKHTPLTLYHYHMGITHYHGIAEGLLDVVSSSTGGTAIQTEYKLQAADRHQTAVILAKAMEGGTDTEIDVVIINA